MKTEWVVWALVALICVGATSRARCQELVEARQAAIEAARDYEDQNYEGAIVGFSRAIDLGLDHETVRFDLANAYYKNGDLGRAILWYERARRLSPRDRAIRHNLAQARSQMQDREISSHVTPVVVRPVVWVRDLLSLDEWSKMTLLLVLLVGAVAVWRQWSDTVPMIARRLLPVGLGLIAVCGIMIFQLYREQYWVDSMVVVAEESDVHSGPGSEYDVTFRVHAGLVVPVDGRRGDWARIDLGGELVGWLPLDAAEGL